MKRTVMLLAGNALAAFMDFGIGTAIAAGVATWYGTSLPWYLVFLGGVLSLVPDFDLVPSVIRGISPSFDHRQTPFHRPLLMLPLTITTAYLSLWWRHVGTDYRVMCFWPLHT